MDVTISEIAAPASLDSAAADDFRAAVQVSREVVEATMGNQELAFAAEEVHPKWFDPRVPKRLLVARADGRIVARGVYESIDDPEAPEGWAVVEVLPPFRRRGIGSALLFRLEDMAREDGRAILQGYQLVAAGFPDTSDDSMLRSPTGFGAIPHTDPGTAFGLHHGYTIEQVDRVSRLRLPFDAHELSQRVDAAANVSGPDYVPVLWEGATPERWLDDIAVFAQRIAVDAPTGGLDVTEEDWDGERVRAEDVRESASPRIRLTAVALHIPTGRLAGYSQLSLPPRPDRGVDQGNTFVLREHRGHGLGMLVKLANLAALQRDHPGYPSVVTYNAEENRHMLSVNEALGFVPIGYEGAWKRAL
jgi:GNAT superfamily N-acetyltransferase